MTPEQLQKWNELVNVARLGVKIEKLPKPTVIIDLALLLAVDKVLKEKLNEN